jgi:hypothetical protein
MKTAMKAILWLVCIAYGTAWAQKAPASEKIIVTGEVEKDMVFDAARMTRLSSQPLKDLVITSHSGEPRGTLTGLKGFLLRDLLEQVSLKSESPKALSEFYFTLKATDGYKVVFSWNELFNSDTGNHVFVLTEKEGRPMAGQPEHILVVSETDFKTGRRHVRNLEQIVVERAR